MISILFMLAFSTTVAAKDLVINFPEIIKATKLLETQNGHIQLQTGDVLQGASGKNDTFVRDQHANAFIGAASTAFANHYPLELSAGDFWLLILQGVARHVGKNSEALRHKFVNFEGKKEIIVRCDDFLYGSPDNDWPRVFSDFVSQIDEQTKAGVVPLMEASFSTTDEMETIAGRITIMDVCQSFFEYTVLTMCGFPRITLLGTRADWVVLDARIDSLLGLCEEKFATSWGAALHSVTSQFVKAFDGEVNSDFWQSMIKRGGRIGSGAYDWYSGWINVFFPFLAHEEPNSDDAGYVKQGFKELYMGFTTQLETPYETTAGPDINLFPPALGQAPVKWLYFDKQFDLVFRGGFVGFTQDPETLALRPRLGWSVVDETKRPPPRQRIIDFED